MKYSKITKSVFFVVLLLCAGIWLFPIVWAFFTSFKSNDEIIKSDFQMLPKKWTLENYAEIATNNDQTPVIRWFLNSMIISVSETILVLIIVSLAAYGYTRLKFKGREFLFTCLLSTMMFPGIVNLIPNYKIIDTLGWTNSFLAVIVPGAAGVYNIFLTRQFIQGIPYELDEAAIVDGANEWQVFRYIILPLIKPVLTVVALFTFAGSWNDFLWPSVVMTDVNTMPITPGLQLLQGQYQAFPGVSNAGALLALLPMLVMYGFAQKYFMQSMSLNSGLK
jgi:multiple sugar transport system permease protein